MIIDSIANIGRYQKINKEFRLAFDFLAKKNMVDLETGKYQIIKDDVYAIVTEDYKRPLEKANLEAHKQFIDIQYLVKGDEKIGWQQTNLCRQRVKRYNPNKDIVFFLDKPQFLLSLTPGMFAVFFPEDAHMPLVGRKELVKKVIIKIKV